MKKILGISFIFFIIDLVSKVFVIHFLGKEVVLIKNFFSLNLAYNTGVAFSMLEGNNFLIIILNILFILFLLWYSIKHVKWKFDLISYSLIIGGAIGNLFDRIIYGYVIDFLDFVIFGYDYPIFNLADSFIVIGVILLFFRKGE